MKQVGSKMGPWRFLAASAAPGRHIHKKTFIYIEEGCALVPPRQFIRTSGGSWGGLGGVLGGLGGILGGIGWSWAFLGCSGAVLGGPGVVLAGVGGSWDGLARVLGESWDGLGGSLGGLGSVLGSDLDRLGGLWVSWGRHGTSCGRPWGVLGRLGGVAGLIFQAKRSQNEAIHFGCHFRIDFCPILLPKIDLQTLNIIKIQ